MLILDTDVCLSLLKGSPKLAEQVTGSDDELCVTAITAEELFYAANRTEVPLENRMLVEKFLLTVRILHPDMAVIKYIADMRNSLRRSEKKFSVQDVTIYAISKVYGARLVTGNAKRYCFT